MKARSNTHTIKVQVIAGVRREKVEVIGEDVMHISVREQAQGNAANTRVREIIAIQYSVPVSHVRIVRGHRSPIKYIEIRS